MAGMKQENGRVAVDMALSPHHHGEEYSSGQCWPGLAAPSQNRDSEAVEPSITTTDAEMLLRAPSTASPSSNTSSSLLSVSWTGSSPPPAAYNHYAPLSTAALTPLSMASSASSEDAHHFGASSRPASPTNRNEKVAIAGPTDAEHGGHLCHSEQMAGLQVQVHSDGTASAAGSSRLLESEHHCGVGVLQGHEISALSLVLAMRHRLAVQSASGKDDGTGSQQHTMQRPKIDGDGLEFSGVEPGGQYHQLESEHIRRHEQTWPQASLAEYETLSLRHSDDKQQSATSNSTLYSSPLNIARSPLKPAQTAGTAPSISATRSGRPGSAALAARGISATGLRLDTSPVVISPTQNLRQKQQRLSSSLDATSPRSLSPLPVIQHLEEQEEKTNALPLTSASRGGSANGSAGSSPTTFYSYQQPLRTIVRTTSSSSVSLVHPVPEHNHGLTASRRCQGPDGTNSPPRRRGRRSDSIRRLEESAERLSRSSSLDDAIRRELRRDSSGSASSLRVVAEETKPASASARAGENAEDVSITEYKNTAMAGESEAGAPPSSAPQRDWFGSIGLPGDASNLQLQPTSSPEGSHADPAGKSDFELFLSLSLSRHGPGKSSVRSMRSMHSAQTGRSRAEMAADLEPVSLTAKAMDDADRAEEAEARLSGGAGSLDETMSGSGSVEDDDTIRVTVGGGGGVGGGGAAAEGNQASVPPTTQAFEAMIAASPALESPVPELRMPDRVGQLQAEYLQQVMEAEQRRAAAAAATAHLAAEAADGRPRTAGSFSDSVDNAFGDFDGVHCEPDSEMAPPVLASASSTPPVQMPVPRSSMMPTSDDQAHPLYQRHQQGRPQALVRPKSYIDPETGQQMLYYPARVPVMINLPPKISKKNRGSGMQASQALHPQLAATRDRQTKIWLPDPLEGVDGHGSLAPFSSLDDLTLPPPQVPDVKLSSSDELAAAVDEHPVARPRSQVDPEARKSRSSKHLSSLPQLEVKDGSAMATLDSILDASARAPVNAFTDHIFAGKLGDEVYGPEKPRRHSREKSRDKGRDKGKEAGRPVSASGLADHGHVRQRSSFLAPKKRASSQTLGQAGTPDQYVSGSAAGGGHSDDMNSRRKRQQGDGSDDEGSGPRSDDGDSVEAQSDTGADDGQDSGGEGLYTGRPTTLLAELQLRKQAQKLRTRRNHFQNGLHTTLLEMDTVAEVYRRHRQGKRVTLAWEDRPDGRTGDDGDSDEDVPLGVIMAAKRGDDTAAAPRPLGLMEQRELDDNEPLSYRRERLQGRDPNVLAAQKARAAMLAACAMQQQRAEEEDDDAPEGETLAQRMRRLQARDEAEHNGLPRPRPVSGAFSAEMMSQFGGGDDDEPAKDKEDGGSPNSKRTIRPISREKGKENVQPPLSTGVASAPVSAERAPPSDEEGETLGQRRRRLQAEREARGHGTDMNVATAAGAAQQPNSTIRPVGDHSIPSHPQQQQPVIAHRRSLADVLNAHPGAKGIVTRHQDTAVAAELAAAEAAREQHERDERMRLYRAQMPDELPLRRPEKSGGFRGGAFNDGMAGATSGVQSQPFGGGMSLAYGGGPATLQALQHQQQQQYQHQYQQFYGGQAALPVDPAATHLQMQMQMGMPMPMDKGQIDRVERWRQGVMP